jgi:hypothetical protein
LYDIEMDLIEMKRNGMDWTYLAQDRDQCMALENRVMNLGVP